MHDGWCVMAVNLSLYLCLSVSLFLYTPLPPSLSLYIFSLVDYTELTTSSVMQVSVCD